MRRLALILLCLPCLVSCLSFHRGPLPGEPEGDDFVDLQGVRVRYLDQGTGPAVVLLHGFASSLDAWRGLIPSLVESHRVIALDLKGFGWTDRPAGDYSPDAQAELVISLMDKLGVERAAVVAHSWGSSVALALALLAPKRVTRLALYDAWVFEEQLPMFFMWSRARGIGELLFALFYNERPDERLALAFFDPQIVTEELAEKVESSLKRPGTRAAALAAVRGQRFEEQEKKYASIQQPTLLLWGREDIVSRLDFGERLANEMPRAKLLVYPRCGHFPMIEAVTSSTRDLLAFLLGESP